MDTEESEAGVAIAAEIGTEALAGAGMLLTGGARLLLGTQLLVPPLLLLLEEEEEEEEEDEEEDGFGAAAPLTAVCPVVSMLSTQLNSETDLRFRNKNTASLTYNFCTKACETAKRTEIQLYSRLP